MSKKKEPTESAIKAAFSKIGQIGGKAGRGPKKARSPEHYQRISKMGHAKRWGKKE